MKRIIGIVLCMELFVLAAPLTGQSLAELARKERERQKNIASKLYTNADLAGGAAVATPAATAPVAVPAGEKTAESEQAKPTGPTDKKGRDEKFWRDAFKTANEDLKRAGDNARIAELKVNDLNRQLLTQTSMYNREYRLQGEITAAKAALDKSRQDLEQAKQKIVDLEDELRRSGGPPGWARERL